MTEKNKKIKVLLATPTMDGKLEAFYVDSLLQTLPLAASKGYEVQHLFVGYDAMLPRARNDLMKVAIEGKFDNIIFIDADMMWNPDWVIELIENKLDFVGGTARKKSDATIDYAIKVEGDIENPTYFDEDKTLLEVAVVGTGFLKLSRKAMEAIDKVSKPYTNGKDSARKNKMYFEYSIDEQGELLGEDSTLCKKWKDTGGKCYLHTKMTCGHVGSKLFLGDFPSFYKAVLEARKKEKENPKEKANGQEEATTN